MIAYLDPVSGNLREESWQPVLFAQWGKLDGMQRLAITFSHIGGNHTREPETRRCYICWRVV